MNKPDKLDDNQQADGLTDLQLTDEHAEVTKAGSISPFGNFQGGVFVG